MKFLLLIIVVYTHHLLVSTYTTAYSHFFFFFHISHDQNLHEYLNNLVEAISITPSDEAILRNPQVVLDAALNADDDAVPSVEKVQ